MKDLLVIFCAFCVLSCSGASNNPDPEPSGSKIKFVLATPLKSSYQIVLPYTLTQTEGQSCRSGIVWSQTNQTPTLSDNRIDYYKSISVGNQGYGAVVGAQAGKPIYIRAFAINSNGVGYSTKMTAQLEDQATPITFNNWQPITSYALPKEVKLYSITTTIDSKPVKMWYAQADLSAQNIEFFAAKAPTAQTTTDFTKSLTSREVYVMINAGFFGSNSSYSYVSNRGELQASNTSSLTRSDSTYNVTRAVMGVSSSGVPKAGWSYNAYFYNKPLPALQGGPILHANEIFPSQRGNLDLYSGIGGGPMLVYDGKICFDYLKLNPSNPSSATTYYLSNYELLQSDIFEKGLLQPRTAIGFSSDGKTMVLLVADGRQNGISEGLTLDNLARIMMGLGCSTAMNLDGGGSTTMVATSAGTLINTPSNANAEQRAVLSFVGFIKKQ